jgi:uncharacterized membrane protein
MRKIFDIANIVLLVLLGNLVLRTYSRLPSLIPTSFDFAGNVREWGGRSTVIILASVALGVTAIIYLLMPYLSRLEKNPRFVNLPGKEELFELLPEKRIPYWEMMKEFMAGMAVAVNLLFFLLVRGITRFALGAAQRVSFTEVGSGLAVLLLVIAVYLFRMKTLPGKIIRGELS